MRKWKLVVAPVFGVSFRSWIPWVLLHLLIAAGTVALSAQDLPRSSVAEFEQAVRLVQDRLYPEALETLDRLAQRHPRSFEVHHLLAIALDLSGELPSANRYFHRAVKLNPASVAARTNLGASYVRLGRYEEAVPHLELAIQLEPHNSAAAFNLGMIRLRERDFQGALPWLEQAWRLQSQHPENAYRLAFCNYVLGNHRRVAEVLSRVDRGYPELLEIRLLGILNRMALGREENPEETLAPILRQLPEMVDSHEDLALLLFSRNLHAESLPLLEQAALHEPESSRVFRNLALAYLRSGRPEEAKAAGLHALALKESAGLHAVLGEIYETLKDLPSSVRHYYRAVELDSSEPNFFILGRTFLRQANWRAAVSVFLEGLNRHPRSWRLWIGFGTARLAASDFDGAGEAFLRAVEIGPREQLGYRFLSFVFHRSERWFEDAFGRFERYYQRNRQEPWASYFYALAQVRRSQRTAGQERLQLAVVVLEETLRRNPDFFEARLLLGETMLLQGQWAEAVDTIEKALQLDPRHPKSRLLLESAQRKAQLSGDLERTPDQRDLRLLSEPDPESRLSEAIEILNRL